MATHYTGTVTSTGNSHLEFRMRVEETAQGIVGGVPQSTVSVKLQTRRTSSGTTTYKQNASSTVSVGDSTTSRTIDYDVRNYGVNDWEEIRSRSGLTIVHDAQGKKKLSVGFTLNLSGTSASSASGSWNVNLTDIPMGSSLSLNATSYTIGSSYPTATATINYYNASYYHKLVWKIGSTTIATQTALNPGVGTATYTFTSNWLNAMPSASSAACSCTLSTYEDNGLTQQVGVDSVVNFTLYATVAPTIGTVTAATVGGINNVWVGGYTKAKITASSVAAGTGASGITTYEFIQDGVSQATYSSSAATYNWTTTNALTAGSHTFTVKVTDSRGNSATKGVSVTVLAYATPKISATSIFRCNGGGTADNEGTYISVKGTATATPTGNSIVANGFKVYTKESSDPDTSYTDEGTLTNGTAKLIDPYAYTSSWNVKLTATDALGNTSTYVTTVPTAAYTMDFKAGGLGVSFGKVAQTDNLLDSAWPIKAPDITTTSFGLPKITKVYAPSATTQTFTLTAEHAYFVVITKVNATSTAYQGLFLVQCYGTYSAAREIASTTAATVSVSGTTLTVTTSQTYVAIKLIDLGGTN